MVCKPHFSARSIHGRRARPAHSAMRIGVFLVFLSHMLLAASLLLAAPSIADGSADPLREKADWQRRYYALRLHEARLVKTIELATKEYADSNRRNYRRSGVRHFHRTNANDAKAELKKHRERIEQFRSQFRAAGGSIYWLDEVDEEPIDIASVEGLGEYQNEGRFGGEGAYAAESPATKANPEFDDGRNPRFLEEEADSDVAGEPAKSRYDFDAWRTDRSEYEGERVKERHLRRNDY